MGVELLQKTGPHDHQRHPCWQGQILLGDPQAYASSGVRKRTPAVAIFSTREGLCPSLYHTNSGILGEFKWRASKENK